jgi:flavorubredoxin
LMTTDATAYASALWTRFIPHFGLDRLVLGRLKAIPDEGMILPVEDLNLVVVPAHFLHSCGNFHLYDPVSRVYYSGDLGSSLGAPYRDVPDFEAHIPYMDGFHRRYMSSSRALRAWVQMVRTLDIQILAPQHGALFRGPAMVNSFLQWCEALPCGIDLLEGIYRIPTLPQGDG